MNYNMNIELGIKRIGIVTGAVCSSFFTIIGAFSGEIIELAPFCVAGYFIPCLAADALNWIIKGFRGE